MLFAVVYYVFQLFFSRC